MRTNLIYNQNILRASCFLFFVLVSCSVMGQVKQKKQLTPADYHLWSTMESTGISKTGLWVSYGLHYNSDRDTLFVRKNDGKITYSYPFGTRGKFCGDSWFACDNGKAMSLTNLKNGKLEVFTAAGDYEFSSNGKYLFVFSRAVDNRKMLTIRNLLNGTTEVVENISCWRFNSDKTMLVYGIQNESGGSATVISFQNTIERMVQLPFTGNVGTNVVWQKNSGSFVMVLQSVSESTKMNVTSAKLAHYRFSDNKVSLLDPLVTNGFSKDKHIESPDAESLKISDDGKMVFFQEVPNMINNPYKNPLVEVWHGDDKLLYSERAQYDSFDDWAKVAVWYPDATAVFEFMSKETHLKLSGDHQFAVTSSMEPCELQFRYSPDRDYYITNLVTKERKLWMQCHSPELHHTIMSPNGKYIAYFKDGNWYSYDIATAAHKNLTSTMGVPVYDEANDIGDKPDAYGFAGWTLNDKAIVIYDKFDVWEVKTDGTDAKRITKGREKSIVCRITKTKATEGSFNGVYDSDVIDLKKPLVLKALSPDESMQGYYVWENGKEKPLEFSAHRIYDLKKAEATNTYIWLEEDYEHPTSLQFKNGAITKTVYQSNPQQDNYFWGKVTSINYMGATGKPIKGLLYYPTDYEKGKKYPMIVRVYQKTSDQLNYYRNPSNTVYDGFSIVNFVTMGYFVLLPDIDYSLGNPADSAVVCTTAAVNKVLSMGDVDSQRIGLIGHSFGGYETSYIITKSNLFATAVAGAAFTDLLSEYLTVSDNYKKAEFWRYEYFTNRMIKPLFEDFDGYIHNSSVFDAPNIKTPLLLWTGEKDGHVAPTQSMELYLAMRRLGKKVTMLRYPNEDHNLENPAKQADLINKVMEWFDYYLNDKPKKDWMGN
ncbi:alpha/beta hydrolase family protein [Flavobacterium terrisoli]|uniref:alpha/beta hydrolase family protein n=1 Tax=Flavobacterium terrisoli TaxID=3242195 RepID=UPI0025434402|nr:prolyl oligopeptidase family serine peptidase [Flavobacterium buctense]